MKWLAVLALVFSHAYGAEVSRTLPPVHHPPSLSQEIRIWGHPELEEIVARWGEAYAAQRPLVRIHAILRGSDIAMAGLYTGQADLALLGRDATASEIQAFEWVYQYKPSKLVILRGSVDTPGRSAALTVLVHESNPLESVKLSELDALFSYQPQQAAGSLTVWGQLGPEGAWRSQPVRLYSLDTETGTGRFFRHAALAGARHLNWSRLREFTAPSNEDELSSAIANRDLLDALKQDPYGIAVAIADSQARGIKALSLAACHACEPVALSPESVSNGSYPLSREVLAYFNQPAGQGLDPVLKDFLDFVRGPGQSLIRPGDGYLALAPADSN